MRVSTRQHASETTIADPIDREALRAKYRQEREKRLRPDGNDQYIEPTGRFAHFLDDPYAEPVDRAPVSDEVTVVIIGGGFSGLVTGARLKQAGVTDVRIIEGGGDVGGAWYWNRYPGAMCDTAAMIYLPLLEETGHRPTQKYTFAPEIFGHAQRIARHFGLYEKSLFSTEVTALGWDETSSRWVVQTNRGDRIRARFVSMGTGPLHRPKLPGIPGLETFTGHCFHTSRWDYGYTGGAYSGAPMDKLGDKRVGIIGTGATSVQCIPQLARAARELFVFQRTPSSIDVRNNHPIEPEFFSTLEAGWQEKWLMNFATLQAGGFADEDLVKDGWTDISQRIRDRIVAGLGQTDVPFGPEEFRRAYEESDDEKMAEIRARVDAIVADPRTAQGLKPWYRQLCKRPCFHDEYLQAFNEPGVELVDSEGRGVEADRRVRGLGRRGALRARLPHLRVGLRSRHRLREAIGLPGGRSWRAPALGALGRGHANHARHFTCTASPTCSSWARIKMPASSPISRTTSRRPARRSPPWSPTRSRSAPTKSR